MYEKTGTVSNVFVSQILEIFISLLGLSLTIWNLHYSLLWSPVSVSHSFQHHYSTLNNECSFVSILQFFLTGALTVSAANSHKPCTVSINLNCFKLKTNALKITILLFFSLLCSRSNAHRSSAI